MLGRIFRVNDRSVPFGEKVTRVFFAYSLSILWLLFGFNLLIHLLAPAAIREHNFWVWLSAKYQLDVLSYLAVSKLTKGAMAFLIVVAAPLIEEIPFRWWAITHAQTSVNGDPGRAKDKSRYLVSTIFLSSVIFGVLHGSIFNVFLQGVGGLILCWLYLRNGNSYWSCVFAHAFYNATIIMITTLGSSNSLYAHLLM